MKRAPSHEAIPGFSKLDILTHNVDKRNRTLQGLNPLGSKTSF